MPNVIVQLKGALKMNRILCLALPMLAACLLSSIVLAEESIEGKHLKNMRQVTSGMVKAGEGYFSPDGKTIIYQAVPKEYPFYQIYKQPLAGGSSYFKPLAQLKRTTVSFGLTSPLASDSL